MLPSLSVFHSGTALLSLFAAFIALSAAAQADVTISSAATQNISCSGGVCTPTASRAVLNTGDLETMLASGNVEVTTTGSGVQANNIVVGDAFSWSAANALTLDAYQSVSINKGVAVQGQAGLTLTTDDGGTNGTLVFGHKGSVTFVNLASSLTINGVAYTLVNTIQSLAAAIGANPSGAYALASNYDASGDGTYTTVPVSTTFTGTFEGLGNSISNLSINDATDTNVGLLAEIDVAGTLRDINLKNTDVTATANDAEVGTLAGESDGSISNVVSVKGSVNAEVAGAGGLVGCLGCLHFSGTILQSSASGVVTASTSDSAVGGLVSDNWGTISLSHTSCKVSGNFAGGAVGYNDGIISQSYASGRAIGVYDAGGFLGENLGTVSNSYAAGSATVDNGGNAGGFAGANGGGQGIGIDSSYAMGRPKGQEAYLGGFVGDDAGADEFYFLYWDVTTSHKHKHEGAGNRKNDYGLTGLSTEQFQSGLPSGFDPSIWGEDKKINGGLPYLLANRPR